VELQSLFDTARPAGRRCAMRSNFMAALPDAAIEILVKGFRTTPSRLSAVIVEHCHGAIARIPPDATAFGLRRNPYHLEILGFWDQANEDGANLGWVERHGKGMRLSRPPVAAMNGRVRLLPAVVRSSLARSWYAYTSPMGSRVGTAASIPVGL